MSFAGGFFQYINLQVMKIRELLAAIESFAAPELQEVYDNAGLITGSLDWECKGMLCSFDVTQEVVNDALEKNCTLLCASLIFVVP